MFIKLTGAAGTPFLLSCAAIKSVVPASPNNEGIEVKVYMQDGDFYAARESFAWVCSKLGW